jgi:hypothetical protein
VFLMLKDFDSCPHCRAANKNGIIKRLEGKTPMISRSDGSSFHVYLFSGLGTWYPSGGTPIAGRMMAIYFYASDTLDLSHQAVMVVFRTTDLKDEESVEVMRDAADRIAELLAQGKQPGSVLYYDRGSMSALGPRDRP